MLSGRGVILGQVEDSGDVIVIGAGLAGLACAWALDEYGFDVTVFESSDRVGGRAGGPVVDGFKCDWGLQWFDAQSMVIRAAVDVAALRPQAWDQAMVLADPGAFWLLRPPQLAFLSVVRNGIASQAEVAKLIRWSDPMRQRDEHILAMEDMSLADSFQVHGLEGRLLEDVLMPAARIVLGDQEGLGSYQYAMLMWRRFLLGSPSLPALGMQALPDLMARNLNNAVLHGVSADSITRVANGQPVIATNGGEFTAKAVVVATDPRSASALVGTGIRKMQAQTTWWYAAPEAPTTQKCVFVVPQLVEGPIAHAAVVSNIASRYAPGGSALIGAASRPGVTGASATDSMLRGQLSSLFQTSTRQWELLRVSSVEDAHPVVSSPMVMKRDVDLGDGIFVAGDHRDLPGFEGAIRSGHRAADAVFRLIG